MSKFNKGDRVKITATQEAGTVWDADPDMRECGMFAEYAVSVDIGSLATTYDSDDNETEVTLHSGTVVFAEEEELEAI